LVGLLQEAAVPVESLACATAERLGFPAATAIERIRRNRLSDLDVIGRLLSPACYIDQSLPAVLYLAARYAYDFEAALIANANAGGDNCHRGAVLGPFWARRWASRRSPSAGFTDCKPVPSWRRKSRRSSPGSLERPAPRRLSLRPRGFSRQPWPPSTLALPSTRKHRTL
jgi:hypothetical protein